MLSRQGLEAWLNDLIAWVDAEVLTLAVLIQIGVVVAALLAAWAISLKLRARVARLLEKMPDSRRARAERVAADVTVNSCWMILLLAANGAAALAGLPNAAIDIVTTLVAAWIVIRLISFSLPMPGLARLIAIVAWAIAALHVVRLLQPTIALLQGWAIKLGDLRVSAMSVIEGVLILILLLWVSSVASALLARRMSTLTALTPSVQVLTIKLMKIIFVTIAIVAALSVVGIDLTAFAVFTGAVGVGVGFGLQKVVSNLVSGVIILLDRSVKPGDVIAVSDYYGRIDALSARYVSVITRDGVEHIIPNEELITQRVENWSHSNNLLRLKIPVGISYRADVKLAMRLCLEAAAEVERVLDEPKTVCLLRGFGDSSVDLEIRFWINDPMNGRANVRSQILLGVWDRFHEHGVEIPFPQRDLHIKSPEILSIADIPADDARRRGGAG